MAIVAKPLKIPPGPSPHSDPRCPESRSDAERDSVVQLQRFGASAIRALLANIWKQGQIRVLLHSQSERHRIRLSALPMPPAMTRKRTGTPNAATSLRAATNRASKQRPPRRCLIWQLSKPMNQTPNFSTRRPGLNHYAALRRPRAESDANAWIVGVVAVRARRLRLPRFPRLLVDLQLPRVVAPLGLRALRQHVLETVDLRADEQAPRRVHFLAVRQPGRVRGAEPHRPTPSARPG